MTTTTRTTIAQYSADPHNPWHLWMTENCSYGQHMFILKAVKLSRLRDEGRASLAMMHDNLEMMVRHHDLDRDAAYDKWSEYETFKVRLTEYREAVLRAEELGAK